MLSLLCGIPGSGKSRLSQKLESRLCNCSIISFDSFEQPKIYWDDQSFEAFRRCALDFVASAISDDLMQKQQVIMLDDTMHLRSMRHDVYKLCRDNSLPMLVIWLNTDVDMACIRNEKRDPERRVAEASFQKVCASFEPPTPSHICDRWSLEVRNFGVDDEEDEKAVERILSTIHSILNDPAKYLPPVRPLQPKEILIGSDSPSPPTDKKQLDEQLRRLISLIIQKTKIVDPALVKVLGSKLANCKTEALHSLTVSSVALDFPRIVGSNCTNLSEEQQAIVREIVIAAIEELNL